MLIHAPLLQHIPYQVADCLEVYAQCGEPKDMNAQFENMICAFYSDGEFKVRSSKCIAKAQNALFHDKPHRDVCDFACKDCAVAADSTDQLVRIVEMVKLIDHLSVAEQKCYGVAAQLAITVDDLQNRSYFNTDIRWLTAAPADYFTNIVEQSLYKDTRRLQTTWNCLKKSASLQLIVNTRLKGLVIRPAPAVDEDAAIGFGYL